MQIVHRVCLLAALLVHGMAGCTPAGDGSERGEDATPTSDMDSVDLGSLDGAVVDEGIESDVALPDMAPDAADMAPCVPTDEVCNGIDDDCDGTTDEGLGGGACVTGEPGPCGPGTEVCIEGVLVCERAVEPADEVCDGLDNDCNGVVDDAPGVGVACSAGIGSCERVGEMACDAAGEVTCNVVARGPREEICDGRDSDCNGIVDDVEGVGEACTVGVGACAVTGIVVCQPGGTVCDAVAGAPGVEVCDGIDNDCDGIVDDVPGVGVGCEAGVGACRVVGTVVCTPDGPQCDAIAGEPGAEVCDGTDTDCNGVVDDAPGVGEGCSAGVGVCEQQGTMVCAADGLVCDAVPGRAGREICDGLDNDCDGAVDDVPGLGAECTVGVGACAAEGVTVCGDSAPVCSAVVGEPSDEVCDDIDNDCNGVVDDSVECGREICDNEVDDDGNALTDCDDPACVNFAGCIPPVEDCEAPGDEDRNGLADCEDPLCVDLPACAPPVPEDCLAPGDEDGNGVADCDDEACAGLAVCAVTPIAAPGRTLRLAGSLGEEDPTWVRPGPACGNDGADLHPYEALRIGNLTGRAQTVDLEAIYVGGLEGDGYLHLFREPFDPADLRTCVVGDDDGDMGRGNSEIAGRVIEPGEVWVLVVSSYYGDSSASNRFIGPYEVVVSTRALPEDCSTVGDEDENGLADCADPVCLDAPGCPVGIAPPGLRRAFAGTLDAASARWERLGADCGFEDADLHPFELVEVINRAQDERTLDITATFAGDGYLHVFAEPFDLIDGGGCIAGNDDGPAGARESLVEGVVIAPGEVLAVVVSSRLGGAFIGDFDLTVATRGGGVTAIGAPGATVELGGVIDRDDATWGRPGAACGAEPADQHPYEFHEIVNDTGAARVIDVYASYAGGDGYVHVFRAPFDPADLTRCVRGDDDGPGGIADSLLEDIPIAAGEVLVVVVSTYWGDSSASNRFIGEYTVEVTTLR